MFSTICLLFFVGFLLWMNTSKRITWADKSPLLKRMAGQPLYSKWLAGGLFLLSTILCINILGAGSGLFAAVVLLMLAGSVSVLFFPFLYFGSRSMAVVYVVCVLFEIFLVR